MRRRTGFSVDTSTPERSASDSVVESSSQRPVRRMGWGCSIAALACAEGGAN